MNESAFPTGDQRGHEPETGMTLRDYFAAAALTGLLTDPDAFFINTIKVAGLAYQYADAMLKVREPQEAPHTQEAK